MAKDSTADVGQTLEEIRQLLQHLLALELSKSGMNLADIAKSLHIAKASAGKLLSGVKGVK